MPRAGDHLTLMTDIKQSTQLTMEDSDANLWNWKGRTGAAQYWYEYYNWPEGEEAVLNIPDGDTVDSHHGSYRLGPPAFVVDESAVRDLSQTTATTATCRTYKNILQEKYEYPEDAFHLVTQLDWEKRVIWDPSHTKYNKERAAIAGWIPSAGLRTVTPVTVTQVTLAPCVRDEPTNGTNEPHTMKEQEEADAEVESKADFRNMFYIENSHLVFDRWEDNIIWEVNDTVKQAYWKPKVPFYDATDDNMVFSKPKEELSRSSRSKSTVEQISVKSKTVSPRKSKVRKRDAGAVEKDSYENGVLHGGIASCKDPYNISNDEYYHAKKRAEPEFPAYNLALKHSTPVMELRAPFMPTWLDVETLRSFRRQPSDFGTEKQVILPLTKFQEMRVRMRKVEIERNKKLGIKVADMNFMRRPFDLTGKDGELILVENCEEYPPVLSQTGMCSKIVNYFKRKPSLREKDQPKPPHSYGEVTPVRRSTFLGELQPGQLVSVLENNLYRCPIYQHIYRHTDFLLIRSKATISLRGFDAIFTAGQHCPKFEVPPPNSTRVRHFVRDFIRVFTYRKLSSSQDNPKRVRFEEIVKAFPNTGEGAIRKWLSTFVEIKRVGNSWWVTKKQDVRLPVEEDIRKIVTPEHCCVYYSLLAAEQRLKDLGYYGEKCLLSAEDGDNDEDRMKMEDEVKAAPWNTTSAFIQAMKGRYLLQIVGPADPTGCGEGFSYVRVPKKQVLEQDSQSQQKRVVTGTDADLRRLSVKNAKTILKRFGLPDEEIKKLPRWEIINHVRKISTEKEKAGVTEKGMTKFSRFNNKMSSAMNLERYKDECQRVFDLQNKLLASNEVLSTDDEDSDECASQEKESDEFNIELMTKSIEKLFNTGKTISELSLEEEERERLSLQKMMLGGDANEKENSPVVTVDEANKAKSNTAAEDAKRTCHDIISKVTKNPKCVLTINRKFVPDKGQPYIRSEIERDPQVIAAYIKIRTMKDEAAIRSFVYKLEKEEKVGLERQRRQLKEKLQQTSKLEQEKVEKFVSKKKKELDSEFFPNKDARKKTEKKISSARRKCGACGHFGHVRTSKECPLFEHDKNLRLKRMKISVVKAVIPAENIVENGNGIPNTTTKTDKEDEGSSSSSEEDSSSSSSDSDDEAETDSDEGSQSQSSSNEDHVQQQQQEMVRLEDTKMVLKLPQGMLDQGKQEALEELGIFPRLPPKRRISQVERENADYFTKRYKTTSADRQAKLGEGE